MEIRKVARKALGALCLGLSAVLPIACADLTAVQEAGPPLESSEAAEIAGTDEEGTVRLHLTLGQVPALRKASSALAKKADTLVSLSTLHVLLTSPGCAARELALPVSGDINSASRPVAALVNGLPSLRNWKLKAWTTDAADSVMHIDSTTFYVRPGDTSAVSLRLVPRHSVLVARFFSNNKKTTGIKKLELVVGGKVVDDTTFSKKLKEFDVKLSHKYMRTGASTTVELRAYSTSKKVKYSRAVDLSPAASVDSEATVELTEDGQGDVEEEEEDGEEGRPDWVDDLLDSLPVP